MYAPREEKCDDSKILWEIRAGFFHFPNYNMKTLFRDFNAKVGERIFSNQQFGMRVYIRILIILALE